MTTVLTPEQIMLPTVRGPNKVIPYSVSDRPVDQPYVIGRPRFSVQNWTPSDHYAGPAPVESAATQAFARHGPKPRKVPYMLPGAAEMACRGGQGGPVYRDFYADAPSDFWPCTRERMSQVGMNRELNIRPMPLAGFGETSSPDSTKAALVAVGAGVLAYWLTQRALRSR